MEMVYEAIKYAVYYLNIILIIAFGFKLKEQQDRISELCRRIALLEMSDFARKKKMRDKEE